jgi:maltose phosphorylase
MKEGYLQRNFRAKTASGKEVEVEAIRFCSMVDDECGVIKYTITPVNFDGEITITPFIDGDIMKQGF